MPVEATRESESLASGTVLDGRYEVVRELARGAFAQVYEATDLKAGGRVALKVLDSELSADPRFALRFRQEVRIARELRHPNTIRIWDLGAAPDGRLFAVMELVKGKTLSSAIAASGPFTAGRAAHVVEQILKGMAEAHARGVVHRDIKPDNVLLCEVAGETDFVKILDFGIAKPLVEELSMVKTQTGSVMGTPGYAAPEILMGAKPTAAADVYAVALVLVEMLTGQRLVQGSSLAQILRAQLTLNPVVVTDRLELGAFGAVIRRALSSDPTQRYATCGEMLDDLRASAEIATIATGERAAVAAGRSSGDAPEGVPTLAAPPATGLLDALAGVSDEPTEVMEAGAYDEAEAAAVPAAGLATPSQAVTAAAVATLAPRLASPPPIPADAATAYAATDERDEEPVRRTVPWWVVVVLLVAGLLVFALFPRGDAPSQPAAVAAGAADRGRPAEPAPVPESPAEPGPPPLPELPGPPADQLDWSWLAEPGGPDPAVVLASAADLQVPTASPEVPDVPRRLVETSAQLNARALEMLEEGMRGGRIQAEREAESQAQAATLIERLVGQLIESGQCVAATTQLEEGRQRLLVLRVSETALASLDALRPRLSTCAQNPRLPGLGFDAERFLTHVRNAGARYEAARDPAVPAGSRVLLLEHSVAEYEAARDMLLSALGEAESHPERWAEVERSLDWLDARIVFVLCALDRCAEAALRWTGRASDAPAGSADAAAPVRGELVACQVRRASSQVGFDWPLFLELVSAAAQLYDRALGLLAAVPAPVPERYQARVRLTSEPSGARVRQGRVGLGRTPFDGPIDGDGPEVVLTLTLEHYVPERIRVDLTGGDVTRHVTLEREHPFGRVNRIGGE